MINAMSHYIGPHYNGTRFRQFDFPNMNGTFPVRLVRHGANTRLKTKICGIPSPRSQCGIWHFNMFSTSFFLYIIYIVNKVLSDPKYWMHCQATMRRSLLMALINKKCMFCHVKKNIPWTDTSTLSFIHPCYRRILTWEIPGIPFINL